MTRATSFSAVSSAKRVIAATSPQASWPRWWRLLMIGCALLILCSCRSMSARPENAVPVIDIARGDAIETSTATTAASAEPIVLVVGEEEPLGGYRDGTELPAETISPGPAVITDRHLPVDSIPSVPRVPIGLPPQAWSGPIGPAWAFENYGAAIAPWKPPGIAEPWPRDEYIIDGGDREQEVVVAPDWDVFGLDQEDAVAHYDTLTGQTIVKPTNCVPIYAPRFAAVRQVYGIALHAHRQVTVGVEAPIGPELRADLGIADTVLQPVGLEGSRGADKPVGYRERHRNMGLDNVQRLQGLVWKLLPYEDLALVRDGLLLNSEKPRLAESLLAAIAWNSDEGLQLLIGELPPIEAAGAQSTEGIHVYETEPGKPCLRVCKLASQLAARPGDEIHFTIRFDNVGTETIGNVTILDNLNTRLEFVEGTAVSSLKADFFTIENEGGSSILRWEILDPLEVGQGGTVRFTCRVR